jgi:hypothetical protein
MYVVVTQRTTIYICAAVFSFKFTSSQDVFTRISKSCVMRIHVGVGTVVHANGRESTFCRKDCSMKVIYLFDVHRVVYYNIFL